MLKISLVIATIGRLESCQKLLDSLTNQQFQDFEILIVDQSVNKDIHSLIEDKKYINLEIKYLPSTEYGASRGRNTGIQSARGDIIGFPDDDCWYPADLLGNVYQKFTAHPETSCITGRLLDEDNRPHSRKMNKASKKLRLVDTFYYPSETVLFLRKSVLDTIGCFDPFIGTGARTEWCAGEATDLTIRVIKSGFVIRYESDLKIFHRLDPNTLDHDSLQKARAYAKGMGAVARKNRLNFPQLSYLLFVNIRTIVFSLIKGSFTKARFHYYRTRSFIQGWWSYR